MKKDINFPIQFSCSKLKKKHITNLTSFPAVKMFLLTQEYTNAPLLKHLLSHQIKNLWK